MEIEEALRTYLLTKTGLTALIGTRILTDEFLGTLPAIVFLKISDVKDHTLTGQSTLENPMIQFTAYASTKAGARAIANQIKTAFCDYRGTLSGIFIQKIELQNEISSLETQESIRIFTEDLEFQVNYINL